MISQTLAVDGYGWKGNVSINPIWERHFLYIAILYIYDNININAKILTLYSYNMQWIN